MKLISSSNVDIESSGGWPWRVNPLVVVQYNPKVDVIVILIRWRIGPSSVSIVTFVQWLCMPHMCKQGPITNFCIRDTEPGFS